MPIARWVRGTRGYFCSGAGAGRVVGPFARRAGVRGASLVALRRMVCCSTAGTCSLRRDGASRDARLWGCRLHPVRWCPMLSRAGATVEALPIFSVDRAVGRPPARPPRTHCHTPCGLTVRTTLPARRGPGDCAPPRSGSPARRSLVGERRTIDRTCSSTGPVGRAAAMRERARRGELGTDLKAARYSPGTLKPPARQRTTSSCCGLATEPNRIR